LVEFSEHEDSKDEVVKHGEGFSEPFVISGESSEAEGPSEASFNDPSARQQGESTFGFCVVDDFQPDTVFFCVLSGLSPCIALFDVIQFDVLAGDLSHGFGQ
jgi:hypothetical protein